MVDTPGLMLAFVAGVISFLSPCSLPLVPGYLAAVSGSAERRDGFDPAVIGRSTLFVVTFSLIFVSMGLSATLLGDFLFDNQLVLTDVAGILVVAMGVLMIASPVTSKVDRSWRPPALLARARNGGPVIAGAAFAIAWTPCVGPTLGAILGMAATSRGTGEAALLLSVYSLGLAVPFILCAVTFDATMGRLSFLSRHFGAIQFVAGVALVAMGLLVVTDELFRLNIEAQQLLDRYGLNFWSKL